MNMIFVTEDFAILSFICLWHVRHPLYVSEMMFSTMDHVIYSLSSVLTTVSDYPSPLHGNMRKKSLPMNI